MAIVAIIQCFHIIFAKQTQLQSIVETTVLGRAHKQKSWNNSRCIYNNKLIYRGQEAHK